MITQRGAKKIFATLVVAVLAGSVALSAVDTPETTSVAPVVESHIVHNSPALRDLSRFDKNDDGSRISRAAARPTVPPVKIKPVPKKPVLKPIKKKRPVFKRVIVKPHRKNVKWTGRISFRSHRGPGGIAACIRKYESGGDYHAENSHSTASGAYQFLDSTWHGLGYSGRAMNASPSTQDAAFYKLWAGGRNASQWVTAHKCGY